MARRSRERDGKPHINAGGRSESLQPAQAGTDATLKTRICNSELEPPSCERCGGSFDRLHPHPRMSPKRFCSDRCRKAAENARANERKQHGLADH
jgi:hypothetical protein